MEKDLFKTCTIGKHRVRNRFVRSATGERLADADGLCMPGLVKLVEELARGGVGLIIPGHACVDLGGRSDPKQMGLHDDATLPGLSALTQAAHRHGSSVFVQLTHAGSKADPESTPLPLKSSVAFVNDRGLPVEALTREEIALWVRRFGDAAERAVKAGFDGVQIHLGHGYGLCQFVSPFLNRRTDEYGGSLENRARLALEIYREVRSRVGKDFPVITKMNCDDFIEGGTTPETMVAMAGLLEREGLDAVEMSGGIGHPRARFSGARPYDPQNASEEAYYREAARLFKSQHKIPLILVGGIRSLPTAAELVADGSADLIALCRPLIREPGLIARWQAGDGRRARCVSCNGCGKIAPDGKGIRCALDEAKP